jgi:hypothetical protein
MFRKNLRNTLFSIQNSKLVLIVIPNYSFFFLVIPFVSIINIDPAQGKEKIGKYLHFKVQ